MYFPPLSFGMEELSDGNETWSLDSLLTSGRELLESAIQALGEKGEDMLNDIVPEYPENLDRAEVSLLTKPVLRLVDMDIDGSSDNDAEPMVPLSERQAELSNLDDVLGRLDEELHERGHKLGRTENLVQRHQDEADNIRKQAREIRERAERSPGGCCAIL